MAQARSYLLITLTGFPTHFSLVTISTQPLRSLFSRLAQSIKRCSGPSAGVAVIDLIALTSPTLLWVFWVLPMQIVKNRGSGNQGSSYIGLSVGTWEYIIIIMLVVGTVESGDKKLMVQLIFASATSDGIAVWNLGTNVRGKCYRQSTTECTELKRLKALQKSSIVQACNTHKHTHTHTAAAADDCCLTHKRR